MREPIFVDNQKYIWTKEAAKKFDYTSDYVGQLAREGRIKSTKVGRARYVCEEDLVLYKKRKATLSEEKKDQPIVLDDMGMESRVVPIESDDSVTTFVASRDVEFEPIPTLQKPEPLRAGREENILDAKRLYSIDDLLQKSFLDDVDVQDELDHDLTLTPFVKEADHRDELPVLVARRRFPVVYVPMVGKVVALVAVFAFVLTPFLFRSDFRSVTGELTKSVAVEVHNKIEEDGLLALVADSLTHTTSSVVSSLKQSEKSRMQRETTPAIQRLAAQVYTTLSQGGIAELIGDSIVYVGGAAVKTASNYESLGTFDRFAVNVFTKLSNTFASLGEMFKSLFEFDTEFTRVVVDTRDQGVVRTPDVSDSGDTDVSTSEDGQSEGVVVVPSLGGQGDDETIDRIRRTFSDEVRVSPDASDIAGLIQPIFKEVSGEDYLYVLVPIEEQTSE